MNIVQINLKIILYILHIIYTLGKWMKASIIQALTLEIGDICMEGIEMEEGDISHQVKLLGTIKSR